MEKINELPKRVKANNNYFVPKIYLTAWGCWCINYHEEIPPYNNYRKEEFIASVIIEPEEEPVKIEDSKGINEKIGTAKTFSDAVDMISSYIRENFEVENF